MCRSKGSLALAALTTLGLVSVANAGQFYTVALEGQTMPGYTGQTFGSFSNNPWVATDGNDVVLVGAAAVTGDNAIYDYNLAAQTLTPIALAGVTPAPSPDGDTFNTLGYPVVGNGLISFNGVTNNNTGAGGIYTATTSGASLRTVADPATDVPGTSSPWGTIENITGISGSNMVMEGGPAGNSATSLWISSNGGSLNKLVAGSSSLGVNFASISGNIIAYATGESGNNTGVYSISTSGAGNTKILSANPTNGSGSAFPAGAGGGTFGSFYGPYTDGSNVLVYGMSYSAFKEGLFVYPAGGGTPTVVVGSSTQVPGQAAGTYFNTTSVGSGMAISNGIVAFNGYYGSSNMGIYTYNIGTGTYAQLVVNGTADNSTGLTFTSAYLLGEGIANGVAEYAFEGTLSNGTNGIFVDPVVVPEPCALGLLGAGGLLILRRRRSAHS